MRKFIAEWWKTGLVLAVILLLGLGIRIYHLTILPVFADEAIYIRWSQVMVAEPTLRFLPLSDGKQPLFMWSLMFFVRRFANPLAVGRMVSVLAGTGTAVGIFILGWMLFKSRKAALAACFVWVVSPFAVFFERMALADAMLAFWGVWVLLLGVVTARTRRLDAAMLTGFALGFAGLTKSPALFMAVTLPSVWILADWRPSFAKSFGRVAQAIFLLIVVYIFALAMYNIQRLGPNFQMLTARTKDYVFPISHLWENPRDPFIFHFHRALQWIWIMGPGLIYILVIAGVVVGMKKRLREVLLLGLWFVGPLAVQAMFAKTFTARYILFTLPPLFVLAGAGLISKSKLWRRGVAVLIIGFALQALWGDYWFLTDPARANLPRSERSGYLEEWTAGTGIAEVAGVIKSEHENEPERPIVVGTEGYFGTLPDGLQIYLEGMEKVTVIGVGLGISEVPKSLIESKEAGNKTYLLANTSRLKFEKEPEELGLSLVGNWKKAERPEGYKEYVQHGPRDYLQLWRVE